MGLHSSVVTPQTYAHASGEKVLTMDFVRGPTLSEIAADSDTDPELWQQALVRALNVAALSIVDGPALFHADLHSGNMIMAMGPSNSIDQVAFIDFGCCGQLPRPLRNCLMMQASAFMSPTPDVKQFAEGFAHALERIEGLGPKNLNVDDLARDLAPLLQEMQLKNPFRPGANPMDPELHMLAFKLQKQLCCHGVQLPCEFTLLLKTACFGALYFSLLDEVHRDELLSKLAFSGAAYALSHPREATSTLSRGTLLAYANLLCAKRKGSIVPQTKALVCCATTAGIPLLFLAAHYLT
jgi:predicted unusual protein kinase regulating ubiquinone biosynthesis (AarF/ABC1/UbiB family)